MASGEFVPDELKMSLNKEEESKDSDTERRPVSTRNKTTVEGDDIGLEERDEDLYTGMFKGILNNLLQVDIQWCRWHSWSLKNDDWLEQLSEIVCQECIETASLARLHESIICKNYCKCCTKLKLDRTN